MWSCMHTASIALALPARVAVRHKYIVSVAADAAPRAISLWMWEVRFDNSRETSMPPYSHAVIPFKFPHRNSGGPANV